MKVLLLAALLLPFVAFATSESCSVSGEEYCYQVQWDLHKAVPKSKIMKPVTHFPVGHLASPTGERIPAYTSDPYRGNNVTGAYAFYSYNTPKTWSSNTGYEQSDAELIYFTVDEAGRVSFVLVHDLPGDGSGGGVQFRIESGTGALSLANRDVELLLRDDPGKIRDSCVGISSDCYAWDQEEGFGSFSHKWAPCCTDGLVMGLPESCDRPFRFLLQYDYIKPGTFTTLQLASYDSENSNFEFTDIGDTELRAGGSIAVIAQTCSNYCASKQGCGECSSDPECGWCGLTSTCIPVGSADAQCPFDYQESCCSACASISECGECTNNPECGWCHSTGTCMTGTDESGGCEDCDDFSASVCEGCSGSSFEGHSSPSGFFLEPVDTFCSGSGECVFSDTDAACVCDGDHWGDGCENLCPGAQEGVFGSSCSGNGSCNPATGFCECDCGFTGPDCALTSGCQVWSDRCPVGPMCDSVCGACYNSECQNPPVTGFMNSSDECECRHGWHGDECNLACPGIDTVTGLGDACGGRGTCDPDSGACSCDSCSELDASGTCVELSCSTTCENGACECGSCQCFGAWVGDSCDVCDCGDHGSCNSITGNCDCEEDWVIDSEGKCDRFCDEESMCNGHGVANCFTETCTCEPGWTGSSSAQCSVYCESEVTCSNNGACSTSGVCVCDGAGTVGGYCGENCTDTHDACGVCGGDGTSCLDCMGIPNGPFSLDLCGECGGQGRTCCDNSGSMTNLWNSEAEEFQHTCVCDSGFCGDDCSGMEDGCGVCNGSGTSCCSENGVADASGKCTCEDTFCGSNCQFDVDACGLCVSNHVLFDRQCCSNHGQAFSSDPSTYGAEWECECDAHKCGDSCEHNIDLCLECDGDNRSCCSDHGERVEGNACECDDHFCGGECGSPIDLCGCTSHLDTSPTSDYTANTWCCNEHGTMTSTGCECEEDWGGEFCGKPLDACGVPDGDGRSCCAERGYKAEEMEDCLCDHPRACGSDCSMKVDNCGECVIQGSDEENRSCCFDHGYSPSTGAVDCVCDEGFCGGRCKYGCDDPKYCSGFGLWDDDASSCECFDDGSLACGVECEKTLDGCLECGGEGRSCCNDNGFKTDPAATCHCDVEYACGDECGEVMDGCGVCGGDGRSCCSDRGVHDYTSCVCDESWDAEGGDYSLPTGSQCGIRLSLCGVHGKLPYPIDGSGACDDPFSLMTAHPQCTCDPGWCSWHCDVALDSCDECGGDSRSCCNDHGVFNAFNTCVCDTGRCGSDCSLAIDGCGVCGGVESTCIPNNAPELHTGSDMITHYGLSSPIHFNSVYTPETSADGGWVGVQGDGKPFFQITDIDAVSNFNVFSVTVVLSQAPAGSVLSVSPSGEAYAFAGHSGGRTAVLIGDKTDVSHALNSLRVTLPEATELPTTVVITITVNDGASDPADSDITIFHDVAVEVVPCDDVTIMCSGEAPSSSCEDGFYDVCGVCSGDGNSCLDCEKSLWGSSEVDRCGECGGEDTTCYFDCLGEVDGPATLDACGFCEGNAVGTCGPAPVLTSFTILTNPALGDIRIGDRLRIEFDTDMQDIPVNTTEDIVALFRFSGYPAHDWGFTRREAAAVPGVGPCTGEWVTPKVIDISILDPSQMSLSPGVSTVSIVSDIRDADLLNGAAIVDAPTLTMVLPPGIIVFRGNDQENEDGLQAGDQVLVQFEEPMDGISIGTESKLLSVLEFSHSRSAGSGAYGMWVSDDTIAIVVQTPEECDILLDETYVTVVTEGLRATRSGASAYMVMSQPLSYNFDPQRDEDTESTSNAMINKDVFVDNSGTSRDTVADCSPFYGLCFIWWAIITMAVCACGLTCCLCLRRRSKKEHRRIEEERRAADKMASGSVPGIPRSSSLSPNHQGLRTVHGSRRPTSPISPLRSHSNSASPVLVRGDVSRKSLGRTSTLSVPSMNPVVSLPMVAKGQKGSNAARSRSRSRTSQQPTLKVSPTSEAVDKSVDISDSASDISVVSGISTSTTPISSSFNMAGRSVVCGEGSDDVDNDIFSGDSDFEVPQGTLEAFSVPKEAGEEFTRANSSLLLSEVCQADYSSRAPRVVHAPRSPSVPSLASGSCGGRKSSIIKLKPVAVKVGASPHIPRSGSMVKDLSFTSQSVPSIGTLTAGGADSSPNNKRKQSTAAISRINVDLPSAPSTPTSTIHFEDYLPRNSVNTSGLINRVTTTPCGSRPTTANLVARILPGSPGGNRRRITPTTKMPPIASGTDAPIDSTIGSSIDRSPSYGRPELLPKSEGSHIALNDDGKVVTSSVDIEKMCRKRRSSVMPTAPPKISSSRNVE